MDFSSDQGNGRLSSTPSARALAENRETILREWEFEVRAQIKGAEQLLSLVIINTIPAFLDNLAESLSDEHPRTLANESSSISQEHGGERARVTRYKPDHLIREYQILRDVILRVLLRNVELTEKDRNTIHKSIDASVCDAMTAFFLVHTRMREQFVSTLSHDLRNPLSSAKMSGELILNILGDPDDAEAREEIKRLATRVVTNTKRADRMIQDLLDASVIEIGERIPLKLEDCDLLSIIRDVIIELPRKDQQRIQQSGPSANGYWDRNGLRRAIENLVSNALKYGTPDTPICIRVLPAHERVSISVHNQGKHIPSEEQELLFQAFRRSESAKKSGKLGWGIGLALVRGVAEAHGGSISVDSSPETGTTFMIDIPQDARPFQNAPITV